MNLKLFIRRAKNSIKSKTIRFNAVMGPVVSYIVANPGLWDGYAGYYANAILIAGNIYLRLITTKALEDK